MASVRGVLCLVVLSAPLVSPPGSAAETAAFRSVAADWGIDFRHRHGGRGDFFMTETMGSGVAAFDYDRDGDEDLLFIDAGTPAPYNEGTSQSRLYRNDRGRFVDVTTESRIHVAGYGMGVAIGDVDGDGWLDVYVTQFGPNQLFINRRDGSFREAPGSGVEDPLWSASAAFGDADLDGDLDLYVTNYVDFDYDNNIVCGVRERGLRSYCHPNVYGGLPDRLYLNRGDGTFFDATRNAGIGDASGNGLGVVWADFDDDGTSDIYVANDMTPNFLFLGDGEGAFEESATLLGAALSDRGQPEAGMGVAVGDLDGQGGEDLVVTHLDRQTNAFYVNRDGLFLDGRFRSGLAEISLAYVGFGASAADFDLDGDLDLAIANGHIIHNIDQWGRGGTYRQPNQIFVNDGAGRFSELEGFPTEIRSSRGLVWVDLDNDSDLDLVVANCDDQAEVYENLSERRRFVGIRLSPGNGPAHGLGATIELTASSEDSTLSQRRSIRTGDSYLSARPPSVVFGLGEPVEGALVDVRLEVASRALLLRDVPTDRHLSVRGRP